jgi:hypothetical protein
MILKIVVFADHRCRAEGCPFAAITIPSRYIVLATENLLDQDSTKKLF